MKIPANWKSVIFMLALFLTGVLTGSINTMGIGKHLRESRLSIDNLHSDLMELLQERLQLTAEQTEQIRPVIGEACEEYRLETIRAMNRVNEIVRQTNRKISPMLSQEQVIVLQRLEEERQQNQKDLKSRFFNE